MTFSQLPNALQQFQGDLYSESARWQTGYSDCSSFVGKGLKSLSVPYPGQSVTTDYLMSPEWTTIDRSQLDAGDICVNVQHMITAISNSQGIGQQNPRENVRVDTVENLMYGTGSFVCRRYKNAGSVTQTASAITSSNDSIFSFPEDIVNFFNLITDPITWMRFAMVVGGGIILAVSLYMIAKG